ncbi:hypothetical protein LOC67_23960 [Stieleria sp. JC731]|uniref:hypothetical protein n=1 Tax=Pirellulaceae TaxID=2691357 RepID=UPI001E2C7029|nr:hypothetical protein [Stieleria sp. JC731]MCC9603617.1 hypothetical protein [Stieleria sp. JC731]
MPIQIAPIIQSGGKPLIDLLNHCVQSINTDVLFLYLIGEFKLRPQAQSAVALFDVFCSIQSPACISCHGMIAPKDLRLANSISPLRASLEAANTAIEEAANKTELDESSEEPGDEVENSDSADTPASESSFEAPPVLLPARYLFDQVADSIRQSPASGFNKLQGYYDPLKSPKENLPGGDMNASQRMFVDNVWSPMVRPFLVSAGFWRVSTIG